MCGKGFFFFNSVHNLIVVEVVTLSGDKMYEATVMEDKSVCRYAASSSECFLFCLQQDAMGKVGYIPVLSCVPAIVPSCCLRKNKEYFS